MRPNWDAWHVRFVPTGEVHILDTPVDFEDARVWWTECGQKVARLGGKVPKRVMDASPRCPKCWQL
jgi:hypothetical protein